MERPQDIWEARKLRTQPETKLKRGEREEPWHPPSVNGFICLSSQLALCVAGHRKPWRGILIQLALCTANYVGFPELQGTMTLPAVTVGLA